MCYFVFVGLPAQQQAMLVEQLTKAGFEVGSTGNAAVRAAFPKTDIVSVVTRGGCSCDIYGEPAPAFDEDAQREKYRRKNWSDAKIERAILGRRPVERPIFGAFRDSLALLVRASGAVRILAHSFSGDVETEPVVVGETKHLRLQQYLDEAGVYGVDIVHDVRAG